MVKSLEELEEKLNSLKPYEWDKSDQIRENIVTLRYKSVRNDDGEMVQKYDELLKKLSSIKGGWLPWYDND